MHLLHGWMQSLIVTMRHLCTGGVVITAAAGFDRVRQLWSVLAHGEAAEVLGLPAGLGAAASELQPLATPDAADVASRYELLSVPASVATDAPAVPDEQCLSVHTEATRT